MQKDERVEIKTCLRILSSHFEEKGIIPRIESHVKDTNGRVKKLELWKAGLIGGFVVISIGFPVLFTYFMSSVKSDLKGEITFQINENNNKFFELD